MPAAKEKSRKKPKVAPKKPSTSKRKAKASSTQRFSDLIVAATTGAILGFSAPGFDQSYIAWFGLVPFLLLVISSNGIKQAWVRGLVFALAYDLVYLNWYLHLYPLDWMGFSVPESAGVSVAAWLVTSAHQAVITSLAAILIRALPTTGGFWPRQVEERWRAPALLVIPLLWVLLQNKIGNAHDWLGVPWPMLEYSQYKVLPILQIASCIGGIGLGFIIVMVNCALAGVIATFSESLNFKALAYPTRTSAFAHLLAVALCVLAVTVFGYSRLSEQFSTANSGTTSSVCVVQGNINIEMQKHSQHRFTLSELAQHYQTLVASTPPGLCIWTESALPTYLKDEKETLGLLTDLSRNGNRDMIVGSIDRDFDGKPYNSAFGIASNGTLNQTIYHKRYLVPFGEYMPNWVKYMPAWMQRLTSTPAGTGFTAGKFPVVIDFGGKRVAPLICFETISPELVVTSVRNGGNLLVNLSDLAWFHQSMCGDQMIAFSVLRAVESGRDFVFAANTGPSAIINRYGKITGRSPQEKITNLVGKVTFHTERTVFVDWFN
jgi:apolipoprotein N-acyltransferase